MLTLRQRAETFLEGGILGLVALLIVWKGGKSLEATWLLGGMAVLLTVVRPRSSVRPVLWYTLFLFVAWTVLSYVYSLTQNYGLDEVLRDTSLALVFLWMAGRKPSNAALADGFDRFLSRLVAVIAVATLLACAIGVSVYIFQPVNRFVGTFLDWRFTTDYWPNAWAEFLLLSWPVVAFWSRRFMNPLRPLILGFVIGALLLSYSRGAFLVFLAQAAFWLSLFLIQLWRSGQPLSVFRKHGARWAAFLVGTAAVSILVFSGVNAVRARFHDVESVAKKATFTASEGASSISERRDFWDQSFRLSLQRRYLGFGPYSFRFMQPGVQTEVFATSDHPHNIFLKIAMERGWPAVCFFAFLLFLILFPALRFSLDPGRNIGAGSVHHSLMPVALVAVVGVLAHNLIDYNLQFVGLALPFWLLLGVLAGIGQRSFKNNKCVRIFELFVGMFLFLVLLFEGRSLLLSSLGRHAEAAGDSVSALAWYDTASPELFSRDMHLSRASLYLSKGEIAEAASALDDYARVNRQDARLWIMRGQLKLSSGNPDGAFDDYQTALILGKYNYLEPLEGILTILSRGLHTEMAASKKEEFLGIFQKFGDAILHNTHFIALTQNVETFARTAEILQSLYPSEKKDLAEFTAKVLAHAAEERSKAESRSPGLLW